jgi:FolB domain-containing protein
MGGALETTDPGGDAIHVEQLELRAHVGVPDHEREARQRITLNITVWPNSGFAALGDDISRTINYSVIARSVRRFIEGRKDRLIETLAEATAGHLLGEFPLRQVQLELRKYVLPDAQFVSVRLTRQAGTSSL